jgi:hypothetical protein
MEAFAPNLLHLGIGLRSAILDQPRIGAADHKVRPDIVGRAEQLIDVGLAIPNVNTPRRLIEQRRRLHEIVHPAHAFLFTNRDARRVYPALQLIGPLEHQLHGGQTERQSRRRHHEARVHRDAAQRVAAQGMPPIPPAFVQQPNVLPRIGKFRGIVQHQQRAANRRGSFPSRAKMPGQDVGLVHALIREEPIRGLRIRPILARQWNALGGPFSELLQHHAESLA